MRYLTALFWSFLLVTMLNYVVGAIANVPFNFETGAIVSVIFTLLVVLVGEAIPNGPVSDN